MVTSKLADDQEKDVAQYRSAVVIVVDTVLVVVALITVFALGNYLVSSWLDPNGDAAAQTQLEQAIDSYGRGQRATDPKERFEAFREAVVQARRIEENQPQSETALKLQRDGRIGNFDLEALRNWVALEAPHNAHTVIGRRSGAFGVVGDLFAGLAFFHWIEWALISLWPDFVDLIHVWGGYIRGVLIGLLIFSIYWFRKLQGDTEGLEISRWFLYIWGALALGGALDDLVYRWSQLHLQLDTFTDDALLLVSRTSGSSMWFPTFVPFFQNAWIPYWMLGIVLANECFWLANNREGFVFRFLRIHLARKIQQFRVWLKRDDEDDGNIDDGDDQEAHDSR